jgi:hypothetical protein
MSHPENRRLSITDLQPELRIPENDGQGWNFRKFERNLFIE